MFRQGSIPACAGEPRRSSAWSGSGKVYPRVCGGTAAWSDLCAAAEGLSPRVRGNPRNAKGAPVGPRSIPACAGEPRRSSAWSGSGKVYPRVCGGTRVVTSRLMSAFGLSPRVRGNPGRCRRHQSAGRSIPACAGEPRSVPPPSIRRKVYPRVCGGTRKRFGVCGCMTGLSPRVRGNPSFRRPAAAYDRSIPACAGEPWWPATARPASPVYPRVCGGTPARHCRRPPRMGLSPRVRGNPTWQLDVAVNYGSIPACAGEPSAFFAGDGHPQVYPRVCGGTQSTVGRMTPLRGLSPRVRGNRDALSGLPRLARSIPACAGEPPGMYLGAYPGKVYPRVCGGTYLDWADDCIRIGLSPRVRGNPPSATGPRW